MLSIGGAVQQATEHLAAAGLEDARLEALALLQHVLGLSRAQLYMRWHDILDDNAKQQIERVVERRAGHEPFAYIIGRQPFYDVELTVNAQVLIPRPETELLIERALAWAKARDWPQGAPRVVDVGTGSGAIAVVLARHIPQAAVWAVDVSETALDVARANAASCALADRITFLNSDLLEAVDFRLDIIVANLPYIPVGRLPLLAPDVRDYEPQLALDGGFDGLDLVRQLIHQLPDHLNQPGLCLLEIDEGQGDAVRQFCAKILPNATVEVIRDYAGLERLVCVER